METPPAKSIDELIREDGRYPPEAYAFLHEGLGRAAELLHGEQPAGVPRHVTGQQLCEAMRTLAIERYGHLARTVLERWNVRATVDFGHMVYLLIDGGFMKKTDEDSLEDFCDVFDFSQAFRPVDEFEIRE